LNDWSSDGAVAKLLRELFEAERPRRRDFLETFSPDVQFLIKEFVGPYVPPRTAMEIVSKAEAPQRVWTDFIAGIPNQQSEGRAAAAAFAKGSESVRIRILHWLNGKHRGRLRRGFFERALSNDLFSALSSSSQIQILDSAHFREYAAKSQLQRILRAGSQLEAAVSNRLMAEVKRISTLHPTTENEKNVLR
jgi:hypothetical protein